MYYVYIVQLCNGNLYTGFTGDLRRRINEHRAGRVKSTEHRRPLELIHYEAYLLESDARRREKFLKTTEGKRLLRQQIRDVLLEKGSPAHPTGRPVE
jgi:putative endonuclease